MFFTYYLIPLESHIYIIFFYAKKLAIAYYDSQQLIDKLWTDRARVGEKHVQCKRYDDHSL